MARPKRDIFAEFYDALEAMGEYCAFEIGRYCTGMPAPDWTRFRHQEHDGASAFAHILSKRINAEVDIKTSGNPPSTWTLFVASFRLLLLGLKRRAPAHWRRLDASWRPVPANPSRPTAIAWSLFSRTETRSLKALARARGVSLQSWLLWSLKEAIVPELVPDTGVVAWRVPVNMHGAFPSESSAGNSNFALEVMVPPEAGATDVHKAIRQELRLRRHWVIAKWTYTFARLIAPWMFRKLVRVGLMTPPWQGSFSSSGAVGPEDGDDTSDPQEWFIGLNPVVRSSPLGACSSEWCGRLALSIQIHPALATDPRIAEGWMASWRRFAEGREARESAAPPSRQCAE